MTRSKKTLVLVGSLATTLLATTQSSASVGAITDPACYHWAVIPTCITAEDTPQCEDINSWHSYCGLIIWEQCGLEYMPFYGECVGEATAWILCGSGTTENPVTNLSLCTMIYSP